MKDDGDEEEDDFQTDENEEMEVDKQVVQKRKKVCGIDIWSHICVCAFGIYFINVVIRFSLTDINAVIFMSSRSRVVVFRRNSEIITGNQGVRNMEKWRKVQSEK